MTHVFNCGYGMLIFVEQKNVNSMIEQISENLINYKRTYIKVQKDFFPEYPEWEFNWNLPYLSTEPKILGVVKKNSKYNKKVVFL
jgi:hypothetical protein